jgi:uncharacterized protein (TIGR02246 family)
VKLRVPLFLTIALGCLASGCGTAPPPDTRADDERAIRELEAEWSKAGAAKDLDKFVSVYADDASVFPPNAPIATGPAAIRASLGPLFAVPGFSVTFQSTKFEVARSGDVAYSHGPYALTINDPKGKPMTDHGKFVTAFKKQADGKWKVTADIFNSDTPLPPPAK